MPPEVPSGLRAQGESWSIEDLRCCLRGRPLKPIEDLSGKEPLESQALESAAEVLSKGWRKRNYPAINLRPGEIPWIRSLELSRSWSFEIHSWNPLDSLLIAYSRRPDRQYLERALAVAVEWIDLFDDGSRPHPFAWYDMAVGLRAARLAFLIDAYGRLDDSADEVVRRLLVSVFRHRDVLSKDEFIQFHNNHGFYQAAGQAAMGKRLLFLPGMREASDQASERLTRMLDQQFTSEGVHKEHSPDYHRMVVRTVDTLISSGLFDTEALIDRYVQMEDTLSWFVYPDGVLVNFGDTDARKLTVKPEAAKRSWHTERMRWAVSRGKVGRSKVSGYKAFPESGYYVVREASSATEARELDSYFAFNAAFHSRAHKHSDDLSFVLYELGEPILIDSGRYGYFGKLSSDSPLWKRGFWYSDPHRIYVESTRAHNCVEIDRTSHDRRSRQPYGSALLHHGFQSGVYFCEAHVYYERSIRHARVLAYRPREWLVVFDWLWDNRKEVHEFTQYFNFGPTLQMDSQRSTPQQLVLRGRETHLGIAAFVPDSGPFTVTSGQDSPEISAWWSPSEKVLEPVTQVALAGGEPNFTYVFATLVSMNSLPALAREVTRIAPSGRNILLRWADDQVSHTLRIKRPVDHFSLEYDRSEN